MIQDFSCHRTSSPWLSIILLAAMAMVVAGVSCSDNAHLLKQKSAFLAFAFIGAGILISGAIKVAAHIWPINADVWAAFTVVHDVFSLLFIILLFIHVVLVLAIKEHMPSLTSWISGRVTEEYAEKEHPVWYDEIKTGKRRGYKLFG